MSESTDGPDEADDYIYRGDPSSPQDGEPWNPPAPPPAPPGPPSVTPNPTYPPPGFPPQQPPLGQPIPAKKKRWPWIVAALLVLCGLPLGGCVALIGFGVNELNERAEAIENTVDEFFETANGDGSSTPELLADGQPPCMPAAGLTAALTSMGTIESWSTESTSFVERTGNSYLSSNADPETLFIDGRPDESVGVVSGILETSSGTREFQVLLSKPASLWRICTMTAG